MELMIVLTIVAILAAIAYPGYQEYARKARRADAKIALVEVANLQEKFFSLTSPAHYSATITGSITADPPTGLGYRTTTPEGYYTLAITAGATGSIATSFVITATAVSTGPQGGDKECGSFTIANTLAKGAFTAPPPVATTKCW